jgi:hypothetical protein
MLLNPKSVLVTKPANKSWPCGDPHRFGHRVEILDSGSVTKPRTLLWEYLLLSSSSPLRPQLNSEFDNLSQIFADLSFQFEKSGGKISRPLRYQGKVSLFKWNELKDLADLKFDEIENIGRAISCFILLGISDLHSENIALGKTENGNFVFSPLDVEVIWEKLQLPAQTHLLPSSAVTRENSGLHWLWNEFDKSSPATAGNFIAALLEGFLSAPSQIKLRFDSEWAAEIMSEPIRCVLSPTRVYRNYLAHQTKTEFPTWAEEESFQLSQQDIPYFYRCLNEPETFWFFRTETQAEKVKTNFEEGRTICGIGNYEERSITPENRLAGALQILRECSYKHPELSGTYQNTTFSVDKNFLKISRFNEKFCAKRKFLF